MKKQLARAAYPVLREAAKLVGRRGGWKRDSRRYGLTRRLVILRERVGRAR